MSIIKGTAGKMPVALWRVPHPIRLSTIWHDCGWRSRVCMGTTACDGRHNCHTTKGM